MADENSKIDFIATAQKRFAAAAEDERELRRKFVEDLRLSSPDGDDQWDPQIKLQREQAGRPAMAFPRCHTFVQQVSNEARQNKPQVKFAPRLDIDKDTAEVYEGLARFIQYESEAQIAYETAIEYSAGGSFGYYRFLTDYCDDDSDELDLKIVPVVDPLTIYGILYPTCFNRKPKYAFVVEEIPKDEYKALYGDTEMASLTWEEAGAKTDGWVGTDTVRIAEYWWCEEKKVEGKRRPQTKVCFCKINGMEVLPDTKTEWAGREIPIVPVLGKQMIIEGKVRLASVVRAQKAAQQMLNYAKTRIAETLSNSPIAPYMVAVGQIPSGQENNWANLNRNPSPYLLYNVIDAAGRPVPPPQRDVQEPPIQSLSAFVMQEVDDMKATTGIYDASMGAKSNETSGSAIQARQESANLTTMHFLDNLERSFRHAGDIIEDMIPKIYDTERQVSILGPDERAKIVTINAEYEEDGKKKHYKIANNRVPLVVTMGRAYDTKRMETFDFMQQLVRTVPTLVPIIGDLMMRNSDMAGADEAAERLHKMLPPQLQDQDEPLPPQAQAAIAQANQQMQMMKSELAKLTMERDAKVLEHHGKLQQIQAQSQADMALEDKKLLTQITIAEINTKAQNQADREADRRKLEMQFHDQAHEVAMQAAGAQQDQQATQQQAQIQSQQSAQDAAQSSVQPGQQEQ